MKEYGSNIQKLVEHVVSVPDRDKRTKHAHILIELMRQIHPQMRDGNDYSKKLWDDLYVLANFDLDVDSPFPPPPKEALGKKPMRVPYNQFNLKHKYYGRNLELLVLKATVAPTEGERKAFVSYLVKLMQNFYQQWNKDTVEVDTCLTQILEMSGFKLQAEVDALRRDGIIQEANPKDGNRMPNKFNNVKNQNSSFSGNGNGNRKFKNKNNRRNKKRRY
ncbi:DUF4290 domain-containing protein [Marinilongibacter aquaticus]|uniref:DUF4290 domain-containing protein n=1 Tax=Marinilongibacter aquaticus TaxID=2975157 RepID=UPI0021BDBB6F|nr:DUF4290 domain-containing protein [Marinilongibacter aquaticus]UBM60237.1 DUF4290 domain-containing protein [Marinilongibacter aquaticus]